MTRSACLPLRVLFIYAIRFEQDKRYVLWQAKQGNNAVQAAASKTQRAAVAEAYSSEVTAGPVAATLLVLANVYCLLCTRSFDTVAPDDRCPNHFDQHC